LRIDDGEPVAYVHENCELCGFPYGDYTEARSFGTEEVYDRDRQQWVKGIRLVRKHEGSLGPSHSVEWITPEGRHINVCNCGEGHQCSRDGYCGA
jgi:hypothetical protein